MPAPDATMCLAISSPDGPGNIAVEDGDVVGVDAQQLESGGSVTCDVGGDRFQAEPIADGSRHKGLVLDNQHTHPSNATRSGISSEYGKPHTHWQHHADFTDGMHPNAPARAEARRAPRPALVGLAAVIAAIIGTPRLSVRLVIDALVPDALVERSPSWRPQWNDYRGLR